MLIYAHVTFSFSDVEHHFTAENHESCMIWMLALQVSSAALQVIRIINICMIWMRSLQVMTKRIYTLLFHRTIFIDLYPLFIVLILGERVKISFSSIACPVQVGETDQCNSNAHARARAHAHAIYSLQN
jgi:hypothetical protein